MTENDNITFEPGDPSGNEALAADLSAAMHQQANRFEPTADSFLRLEQAVDGASSDVRSLESRRGFPGRYLAAAALVCVTVGGIGLFVQRNQGTEIQTVPADSTTTPATATSTTVPVTSTQPENATGDDSAVDLDNDGVDQAEANGDPIGDDADQFVAGPLRTTRDEAVRDFMALIRLPFARIDFDGNTATVYSFDPDGNIGQAVSELTLTAARLPNGSDGFAVARAHSPSAAIEATTVDGSTVTVSGSGEGFEAGLGVRIYSSFDGLLFDAVGATGGNFGEVAPYSAEVNVTGREAGWIVVQSSTGADVTAPFSAVPVEWDAGPDPSTYTVSFIPPDDPDGGLNLRSEPTGSVLETLAPGSTVSRRGELPTLVGNQVWWPITTADGLDGWANRRFLARNGEVSDETLELIAGQFLSEFATRDAEFATFLPWTSTKPVKIGWAPSMTNVEPGDVLDSNFWATEHDWEVPLAVFPESVTTARFSSLLGLPFTEETDPNLGYDFIPNQVGEGFTSTSPEAAEALESQFAGVARVHIAPVADRFGNEHPTFTLFVEPGPSGASIVGVAIDFSIP